MTPQRFQQVRNLFEAALEHDQNERAAFLAEACEGDQELHEEVQRLLRARDETVTFPWPTRAEKPSREGQDPRVYDRIGGYRLLSVLGEGGMGIVYLAEQERPIRRRVALKLIKPGIASPAAVARFENERQALARMEHPNIAHVYEAGTTNAGQPYFVMEYVAGPSMTVYCDQYKLANRERLKLFRYVCLAIHHAHQKGVIHQDIKPSNVLVTEQDGTPVPKVIDFGIAKAIDQHQAGQTLFTQQGVLAGTPEYMSPEQANLETLDVDASSDIYSLGVLLYELLVGALPFDPKELRKKGLAEILRIIREDNPMSLSSRLDTSPTAAEIAQRRDTNPGALRRQLIGELDWITMRAMEKDRRRRYSSAAEFAGDIERYLDDRPVLAGPPSRLYKLRKFVSKNRLPVAAAAAVFVALCAGFATSTFLYFRAERARQESTSREREAQWQSYVANIRAADRYLQAGDPTSARQILLQCELSLRGWEWRYLWSRSDMSIATLYAAEPVHSIGFSKDGSQILLAMQSHVDVWSTSNFKRVASYEVRSSKMSRDGTLMISSDSGELRLIEPTSGRVVHELHTPARSTAFSPDSSLVAAGFENGTVRIWSAKSGELLANLAGLESPTIALTLSPDNALIAAGYRNGAIRVWNTNSQRLLATIPGQPTILMTAAFSSDGRQLAWGTDRLRVAELPAGRVTLDLPLAPSHVSGILTMAFAADNTRLLISRTNGLAELRDSRSGDQLQLLAPSEAVGFGFIEERVAVSPDGRLIMIAPQPGVIRVLLRDSLESKRLPIERGRVPARNRLPTTPEAAQALAGLLNFMSEPDPGIAFSASVDHVASVSHGRLRMWQAQSAAASPGWSEQIVSGPVRFSPDGRLLATASKDHRITVWNVATGSPVITLPEQAAAPMLLDFSGDGNRIASVGQDKVVHVWDLKSGRELVKATASAQVIALNPNGTRLAVSSPLQILDVPSGRLQLFAPAAETALRAPQFPLTTIGGSQMVRPDAEGGVIYSWEPYSRLRLIVFSPDGGRIAIGGANGVWLQDVTTRSVLCKLEGVRVSRLKFTPDGNRLATADDDGNITLWNPSRGDRLLTIRCGDEPQAFDISMEGLVCITSDGAIHSWSARSSYYPGATELVTELLREHFLVSEVVQYLTEERTIEEPLRMAAIEEARLRCDNLSGLQNWIGGVVTTATPRMGDYELALRRIQAAASTPSVERSLASVRGEVQYRLERYAEALQSLTLGVSNDPDLYYLHGDPLVAAFRAMTYQRLGRPAEARLLLITLRNWVPKQQRPGTVLARMLQEAEALIEGTSQR